MTQKQNVVASKADTVIWLFVFALAGLSVAGYYHFSEYSVLLRAVALLAVASIICALAYRTSRGRRAWDFWKDARREIRKVVWPTRQETVQTTLMVVAMVFFMGLILWIVDSVLLKIVAAVMGH